MDYFEALQIIAIRDSVVGSDLDFKLRKVYRWYSKTFATPLHTVEDLPLHNVLQAYYEDIYSNMKEEDLHAAIGEIDDQSIFDKTINDAKEEASLSALAKKIEEEAKVTQEKRAKDALLSLKEDIRKKEEESKTIKDMLSKIDDASEMIVDLKKRRNAERKPEIPQEFSLDFTNLEDSD